MRKRAVTKRLNRVFSNGGSVTRHGPGGKGACLAFHMVKHAFGQKAPQPVNRQRAVFGIFQQQNRRACITDRPKLVEERHPSKVEAPGSTGPSGAARLAVRITTWPGAGASQS
jgi:hypothetical protein